MFKNLHVMQVNDICSKMVQFLLPSLTLSTCVLGFNLMALSAFPLIANVQANNLNSETTLNNVSLPKNSTQLITNHRQSNPLLVFSVSTKPYISKWSNGRGETLSITSSQIQFDHNRKLTYKDITRVTDGNSFQIQITSRGKLNYFQRYMFLRIDGKQMTMTGYNSYEDMFSGQNQGSEVTWYR